MKLAVHKLPRYRIFIPFVLALVFLLFILIYNSIQLKNIQPKIQSDATSLIKSEMLKCYKIQGKNKCYEKASQDFLNKFPLEEIMRVIEKNESLPEFYANCHELTHYLGRNEYKRLKSVIDALPKGSHACFEGYQHGVVEGYFTKKIIQAGSMKDSDISIEVPRVCGSRAEYQKNELFNQCLHGIGHAMMLLTESDLPRSLNLCNSLELRSDKELCYSGVFMENSSSSTNKDHPSKFFKKDDPMYPCTILEKKYLRMCYRLQGTKFLEFAGYDWSKTIGTCEKIPKDYLEECYISIGSLQVGYTQDFKKMQENCNLIKLPVYRKKCIEGVVSTLSVRFGGDASRIITFCSLVNPDYKKTCYTQMGRSLKQWTKNKSELERLCGTIIEKEYLGLCK